MPRREFSRFEKFAILAWTGLATASITCIILWSHGFQAACR